MRNPHKPAGPAIISPDQPPAENALVHVHLVNGLQHLCKYQKGIYVDNKRGKPSWSKDQIEGYSMVSQRAPGIAPEDK